jgi:hypothetical protein
VVVAALLGGSVGCGREGGDVGELKWEGRPLLFTPKGLSDDRILSGRLRNDSLRRVDLEARQLTLVDRVGHRIRTNAVFLTGFVHGLYPPTRERGRVPDSELLRTGRIARILPEKSAPVTVSWRSRGGQPPPVRLDYPGGFLPVPEG